MPDIAPARSKPTLFQLLIAFTMIAIFGFGGVLYWSRRMMVDERKWMTAGEFNEAYALCNFLPGPNIVNFATLLCSSACSSGLRLRRRASPSVRR